MKCGDLIVIQQIGTSMGISPALSMTNLYVAVHESDSILELLDISLYVYQHFIDDGIVIWIHDEYPIQDALNWK